MSTAESARTGSNSASLQVELSSSYASDVGGRLRTPERITYWLACVVRYARLA